MIDLYSTEHVANFFIKQSLAGACKPITPMRLQKLMYFTQGVSMLELNRLMFNEQIEAASYGPVIKSLFRATSHYGRAQIPELIESEGSGWERSFEGSHLAPEDENFLRGLLKALDNASTQTLTAMINTEGSPWDQVVASNQPLLHGTDIPLAVIVESMRTAFGTADPGAGGAEDIAGNLT